jgi:hypothetical protein
LRLLSWRSSLDLRSGAPSPSFGDSALDERRAEQEPARQQSAEHKDLVQVSRPHCVSDVHVYDGCAVLVGEPSAETGRDEHQEKPEKDHGCQPSRERVGSRPEDGRDLTARVA